MTATRIITNARQGAILFSTYQTNRSEAQIATMEPDGTGRQILHAFPGHPWGPKLSPDGRQVLFSSAAPAVDGRPGDLDLNGSGSPDIWAADIDGSRAQRLTNVVAGYNGWSWSPDGRSIAFASNRDDTWAIYKMTAVGDELVRLTTSPVQDAWPSWTPDGTGIIFASTRSDQAQLYRMDASGGNLRRLLATPTADTEPTLAPSGGKLAFSAQAPNGTSEIYVADATGGNLRRLTNIGGLNTAPAWSSDGTKIVFVTRRDDRSDLYVINADGSGLTRLTTAEENQRPDWAPPQ